MKGASKFYVVICNTGRRPKSQSHRARQRFSSATLTSDEYREIARAEIAKAMKAREALRRKEKAAWVDAIGAIVAEWRGRHGEMVTRVAAIEKSFAPDNGATAILDLADQRRRRSGAG